jgi:hypothetical protein
VRRVHPGCRAPRRSLAVPVLALGAVLPTLVAWFVVLPLNGLPADGGFAWPGVPVGPVVNGAWGVGTALLLAPAGGPPGRR